MQKGDLVIVDSPENGSSLMTRFYGIVLDLAETGSVKIELADGSVIKRQYNSVAVYIHPPPNWQELFAQKEVLFSHPRYALMHRASRTTKLQN